MSIEARGRTSAARAVDAIADAEGALNGRLAYRVFIQLADDLAAVSRAARIELCADEPALTGGRWDDAIAALAEVRLSEAQAPVPQWVIERQGSPNEFWEPQRGALALPFPADPTAVAEPFLRRGVLIEMSELASN